MIVSFKTLAVVIFTCTSTLASHHYSYSDSTTSTSGDYPALSTDPASWSTDHPPPDDSTESDSSSNSEDIRGSVDPGGACGCYECTNDILNRIAGEYTCGERIEYLREVFQLSEEEACIRIARTEFRFICGSECDPGRCDGQTLPEEEMPSTYCGCKDCTHKIWNNRVDGHTCGARISYLTDFDGLPMLDSCNIVGGHEFPDNDDCGLCDPQRCEPIHGPPGGGESRCGCSRCVDSVWNLDADDSTCGERIELLLQNDPEKYPTEVDACREVAGDDYPHLCGSNCDPDLCDAPLTARTPLYCFPTFDQRVRLRNMWGNHTVEVKESKVEDKGVCGPLDNKFTNNTVSKLNKKELKLQFKKVGNAWEGSEVRIRIPNEDMPFRYGTYSFSVKSVEVINTKTDLVESYILPPSLVLGMHTYDSTENFAISENYNHQVGIDISRFDYAGTDARFTVQPAIDFNTYNFFTGPSKSYKQAPRTYSFDWRPAKIEFYSNSGEDGEESFTYSTQRALDADETDYTQCLPADVEIRISLWNLYGTDPPTNIESDDHVVEVIIDNFNYQPSGLEYVPNGGSCSKDCQCQPTSRCYSNICTKVITHYEIVGKAASSSSATNNEDGASSSTVNSWETSFGLVIFSCSVSALALLSYQAIKMRYQRREEVFPFNLPPAAVKA